MIVAGAESEEILFQINRVAGHFCMMEDILICYINISIHSLS